MAVGGGPKHVAPSDRASRPIWWWFVLHGVVVLVWGVFVLVSPLEGREGWLVDGAAFAVMLIVAGALLVAQGLALRTYGPGRFGLIGGGVLAVLAGAAVGTAAAFGEADAVFWIVIGFYVVEGVVFIAGSRPGAPFRHWGILMGAIIYVALALLVSLRFTIDRDYGLVTPVWGALGVLYGVAMIAASIQVRHAVIAQGGAARN